MHSVIEFSCMHGFDWKCRGAWTALCFSIYWPRNVRSLKWMCYLCICRVLRPPGGGSSNIFGFADDEPKPTKKTETKEKEPVVEEQQNLVKTATDDSKWFFFHLTSALAGDRVTPSHYPLFTQDQKLNAKFSHVSDLQVLMLLFLKPSARSLATSFLSP